MILKTAIGKGARGLGAVLATALVAAQPSLPAKATDSKSQLMVSVIVSGVRSDAGIVRVGVYADAETFSDDNGAYRVAAVSAGEARQGKVRVLIGGLASGTYAIAVYHDENENGRLDKGLFGAPTEGYGFANGARGLFGPPSFSAASVSLEKNGALVDVLLKY